MSNQEALEAQRRAEKIEAWYAAETVALRAKQFLLASGLLLQNAEYPKHLDIYGGLKAAIRDLEIILEHFRKGSAFEEKPRPRGE